MIPIRFTFAVTPLTMEEKNESPGNRLILTAAFSLFANAGIFDGIGSDLTLGKSADIRPILLSCSDFLENFKLWTERAQTL